MDTTGVVGVGGDETFGLCSIIPWKLNFQNHRRSTTYRSYDIAGVTTFHPNLQNRNSAQIGFGCISVLPVDCQWCRLTDQVQGLRAAAPGTRKYQRERDSGK